MEDRLYRKAKYMALDYEMIENIEEYNILVNALYQAMLWAKQ